MVKGLLTIKPFIIKPMEPISLNKVFDDNTFIYQVKWDGVRMLSYIKTGTVKLINKKLNLRTEQYPELHLLSGIDDAILDGEIVVLKKGKPDFPAVLKRDLCQSSQEIEIKRLQHPITYMVFDILQWKDKLLVNVPLLERQALLSEVLPQTDIVHAVNNFFEGSSLFSATQIHELEGIVAKRKTSIYKAGKYHRDWFKIKHRRHQACIIGGYILKESKITSLLLGAYENDKLVYIGNSGTGLKEREWYLLTRDLPRLKISKSPFSNYSNTPNNSSFVEPYLTVMIEFSEWTGGLKMRSPVIKGFIDTEPQECRLD